MSTASPIKFYLLDGLRGVAAVAVIILHSANMRGGVQPLPGAYLAVDFFFLLSGFVLFHSYDAALKRGMRAVDFMRRRYVRLYPLYILALAIAAPVFVKRAMSVDMNSMGAAAAIIGAVLIVPLWSGPGSVFPLVFPAWSLFYELVANAIYSITGKADNTAIHGILTALGLTGLIATVIAFGSLNTGSDWRTLWTGAPRVLFSFFAGLLLYRSGVWRKLPAPPAWLILAALLAALAWMAPSALRGLSDILIVVFLFPLIVAFGAKFCGQEGVAWRALGGLSYGAYVLHAPVIAMVLYVLRMMGINPNIYINISLIISICVLAWVLDRYYDGRARRWLNIASGNMLRALKVAPSAP